jgi:HK97 family phage major capsid protein
MNITAEELKGLIADAVKAETALTKTELSTAVETKFANFAPKFTSTDLDKQSGKEKMATFIKALYNKDNQVLSTFRKSMTEGTGSAGGFVVPEEFTAEVYRIVEDFGLVAKMATRITMGSDTMNIPTVSSSVSISYPGEASAGTESQPVLAQVQLLAKTCIGLTAMSNELLADANVSVVDLLANLFAEAIAGEVDSQALVGTGSPFTGVLGNASVNIVTMASGQSTFSSVTLADLRDLIAQIKPWALQGAGYIMHRSVWSIIQKLRTGGTNSGDFFGASTNPVIVGATQGFPSATAGFLWGYPVYLSDKMPTSTAVSTKFVIFGNLKHVFYGVRQELAVDTFNSGTVGSINLIDQNMSGVRVIARHALAVGLPTAFACLKTSAS